MAKFSDVMTARLGESKTEPPKPVEKPLEFSRIPEITNSRIPDFPNSGIPEIPISRFQESPKTRKPEIRKKVRKDSISLNIDAQKVKALKRFAIENDMFFGDALELAIDLLEIRKTRKRESIYKEHDDLDDDVGTDEDHHRQVKKHFQHLTGKFWLPSRDGPFYAQVKHLPADRVMQLMTTINSRAPTPVGTFSYFAKSILDELSGNTPPQGRAQLRKRYERLISQMREARLGSSDDYLISEFIADLKDRCAREGIAWNDDIVNELLGL